MLAEALLVTVHPWIRFTGTVAFEALVACCCELHGGGVVSLVLWGVDWSGRAATVVALVCDTDSALTHPFPIPHPLFHQRSSWQVQKRTETRMSQFPLTTNPPDLEDPQHERELHPRGAERDQLCVKMAPKGCTPI